jgi:hypothetical protein
MEKNMRRIFYTIIAILVVTACSTTPTSTVAPNINFSDYEFAAIGSRGTGSNVILMDTHMRIQNALVSSGYNVIVDTRINSLDYEERAKLFFVEFSITSNVSESICLIYLTDYLSENLIATFRGSFGFGLSINEDRRVAVDRAIRQMVNVLQNNNREN